MRNKGAVYCGVAALGIAGFAALAASTLYPADARPRSVEPNYQTRTPTNSPLLAVVALAEQHITVYDATGKILQAPVSTGATGYETPAGIYSIVQKEVDHHSNLYDDASMPYMERITWTGMALHAGVLPGYPASHGCVRMPHAFAEQLYGLTELGMRIVVVREDIAPAEIEQPFMFTARQRTAQGQGAAVNISARSIEADIRSRLQSAAASKLSEAETAIKREKELRLLAAKRSQEAAPAARALKLAEANFAQAEAALKAIEKAVAEADNPDKAAKLEPSKAQAESRFEKAKADLETAKQQAQAKMDAATQAEADAKAAAAAMGKAVEAAQMAKLNTSPVSVFISRKTQRLYIRKGNYPIFEEPVTIRDPDKPIGTFVFTSLSYAGSPTEMRWNVVSMYKNATNIEPYVAPVKKVAIKAPAAEPAPADLEGARAALKRLELTDEAQERISEVLLPGASLIISDEGPSNEIGKDTDFIVFMSGEPQGGIAIRQHHNERRDRDFVDDLFGGGRRSRGYGGGGFFSFFGD